MDKRYNITVPEGTTRLYRSLVQRLQEASGFIPQRITSNEEDTRYLQQIVEIQCEAVRGYNQFTAQEKYSLDMLMRWAKDYYRSCWSLYHTKQSAKLRKDWTGFFLKRKKED